MESLRLRGICEKFFKKCKNSHIWTYEVWSNRVRIAHQLIKTKYRKWSHRRPLSNKRLLSRINAPSIIAFLSLYKTPLFHLIKASSLIYALDNKTYQWMDWISSLLTVYILLWCIRRNPVSFLKFVKVTAVQSDHPQSTNYIVSFLRGRSLKLLGCGYLTI